MNNYNCLDLDQIKNYVCEFASILESKNYILNEIVEFNPLRIKQNCIEVKEAMNIIAKQINVQFSGIQSINNILDKAEKGIVLEGIELRDSLVFHNNCERIKKIFNSIDEELNIKDYTDSLNIRNDVFDVVNKCIDNSGTIKDDASPKLKDINSSINNLEKQIYNRAQQFISKHSSSLQELSTYVRENRVTFLVKNSDKNKYGGYAYGTSASGLASYVEPDAFVDMNNQMINLLHEQKEEINRILMQLTYLISTVSDDYKHNFESLVKLNVIFAKANYGYKYNGIIPSFIEGDYFEFKDLCHPLIDQRKVISNCYRIYEPFRGIVISGSNTGGKTVSLKAIGLSIIMSYLGIPIIASDATIPIYKNIYVDIDDNQSIQDSLSTFSAHITNINNVLNEADKNCLILIDELISGTDPKEAQAISLAILDKIKEIGSIFIITTHFDDIKNYSYNDEHILLSSVGFDMDELKPTYKYHENSIGSSNALQIASRYFTDYKIIENANNYLMKNQTEVDELLNKLAKQMDEVNNEKKKLDETELKYEQLLAQIEEQKKNFETEKVNLRKKYMDELNEYIDNIKQKAKDKLDSIKESKQVEIVKSIEELVDDYVPEQKIVINVGDNVRIKDNEQIGTVIEINNDKVSVDIRGMKVRTNLSDLTLMPKIEKKVKHEDRPIGKSVSKEINLVGQRVEDGLIMMEEYLDRANGARLSSVKLIHGIGTGQLRSALRTRLKKLSYVKSFKDGDFYDGGSAVTIVEFK